VDATTDAVGDPDLQGSYTNKYEYGTSFERPREFADRRLQDITPQEISALATRRQQEALARAPFLGGDPDG
jgi:hypothetical protein